MNTTDAFRCNLLLANNFKGWIFKDVLKFVMLQPEVTKGYKDGKYYLLSEFIDLDEL